MEKATSARDVRLPVEVVELIHLRTTDDQPVRVVCEQVDELVVARILRALPGERAQTLRQAPAEDQATLDDRLEVFDEYGPPLIEAGTMLLDGEGGEVRPAFWFDAAKPRHALSIPGRLLRLEDKVLLVGTTMRLSGYGGGAASSATFHAGVGGGGLGGVGTVAVGEDGGNDAKGGTS